MGRKPCFMISAPSPNFFPSSWSFFSHSVRFARAAITIFGKCLLRRLVDLRMHRCVCCGTDQKLVLIGLKKYDLLPVHSLYENQYQSGAVNTTEHGFGISTWGDDISTPELFNDLASAGIQNL